MPARRPMEPRPGITPLVGTVPLFATRYRRTTVDITELRSRVNPDDAASEMWRLIVELYPICRSITGDGYRETLRILQQHVPLTQHEVRSGTEAFDWSVPKEWNIKDAFIKNSRGERVVDFQVSNLHVVGYSVPLHRTMPISELREHLHSLPENPDWIPYRTSYYKEDWGFCVTHKQLLGLTEDTYEVCVDSTLGDGYLTYGEVYIPGESDDEILLSCHACHPSLCNDNLSGVALTTILGKYLTMLSLRHSYRILYIPGTIGSITWLSQNEHQTDKIRHGLVVTSVGDPGNVTYKRSRRGNADIDKAVEYVLSSFGDPYNAVDFSPYGYDERQYCSPGFNLPVGCLQRTPYGQYPEYHTSADNLDFIRPDALADSFKKYLAVLDVVENNRTYRNRNSKCEPQLGKRGLYEATGGHSDAHTLQMAMLWVLNLSDGEHSILDVTQKSGFAFEQILKAAHTLSEHGLLDTC